MPTFATTTTIKETLYRTQHDDYPIEVAFTGTASDSEDLFDDDPITSATVTCSDNTMVISAPDLSVQNVVKFNVSGGAKGKSEIYIDVNSAGGLEMCRVLKVITDACG